MQRVTVVSRNAGTLDRYHQEGGHGALKLFYAAIVGCRTIRSSFRSRPIKHPP